MKKSRGLKSQKKTAQKNPIKIMSVKITRKK